MGGPSKLMRGTVDLVVLRALGMGGRQHGYEVWRWIEEHGGETLRVEDAALYQSLHRLEKKGLVASAWGVSETNRRARFYTLTPRGRTRLEEETRDWHRYSEAVHGLLGEG